VKGSTLIRVSNLDSQPPIDLYLNEIGTTPPVSDTYPLGNEKPKLSAEGILAAVLKPVKKEKLLNGRPLINISTF
jgi:hypothetical protein